MLVGGLARDFATNYRLGAGPDFVIEGDEYDTAFFDKGPKFLHYRAQGTIITAVEFDHADIYRDLDHVKSSFRALVDQMNPGRVLAVCADFPHALAVTEGVRAERLTFGLHAGTFRSEDVRIAADGAYFSIARNGKTLAREVHLPIGGRMNVANALGVWVLLKEFGIRDDELVRGLKSFKGVARRQEIVGTAAGRHGRRRLRPPSDRDRRHPRSHRRAFRRPAYPRGLRAALQQRTPQRLSGGLRHRLRSRDAGLSGPGLSSRRTIRFRPSTASIPRSLRRISASVVRPRLPAARPTKSSSASSPIRDRATSFYACPTVPSKISPGGCSRRCVEKPAA